MNRGVGRRVGAEEGFVAALARGVADEHDLHRLVAQRGVPEGAHGADLRA